MFATDMKILLVTAPPRAARGIAAALLEKRLAACVTRVGPVVSRYWWKGRIEEGREVILLIKTRDGLAGKARACVRANHPYEVPEILVLGVEGGESAYLRWVAESTVRQPAAERRNRRGGSARR